MGLFDKLFRRPLRKKQYAQSINGYMPIFSQYGTDIYASDVVQQALKCIVDEIKKLKPTHVRNTDGGPVPIKSTIQDCLNDPNPLMTTSDFLEKTMWLLLLNYNAFILPTYYTWTDEKTGHEKRYYTGLYPLKPTQVDFEEDGTGKLYVHFYFENNYDTTIPYDEVIHLRYNYSVNEYMGGNEFGQPDHKALMESLNINDEIIKSIAKAMKMSYSVNGVVKYKTMIDGGKTEAALREFENKINNSSTGILPLDISSEYIPLTNKVTLVDEKTLKFFDEKILRTWGISLAILKGDYTKEQYEAFYQKALEPIIISITQAFTKKMFTVREKAYGNKIEFYPEELIFMTIEQKLKLIELLAPAGTLLENEKRTLLGLQPDEALEGKRYMSLNWIDANDAGQYQVGKKGDGNGTKQK